MCDKDYNAYTESENPKPDGEKTCGRSAGFHIHLGYNDHNIDTTLKLIKLFDVYIGIPSIIYDRNNMRRTLYGKAGAFRLTEYGFEYRVLSSAMYATEDLMNIVWNGITKALNAYNRAGSPIPPDIAREVIDTGN